MANKISKRLLQILILTALAAVIIAAGVFIVDYSADDNIDVEPITATVDEVLSTQVDEYAPGFNMTEIIFLATIKSGDEAGSQVEVRQSINEMVFPVPQPVAVGEQILVSNEDVIDDGIDDNSWYFISTNRMGGLISIIIVFLVLILIIGRLKGLATIASLAITIAAIFLVYVPAILKGYNIYLLTLVTTVFIILFSLVILNGFNKKTLCAVVGNCGGVLIAGVLALIINQALEVTGVIDQEYVYLTLLEDDISIDLRAVVWGGILIGSLGAIMDVAMSIASSMHELSTEMKDKTFGRMVNSGMNIGKDAIGTMTNTLILAYIGSSLAVVLLFTAYNRQLLTILNFEMIVVEIIQAIVGSIGILLAVPATVLFAAWVYNRS